MIILLIYMIKKISKKRGQKKLKPPGGFMQPEEASVRHFIPNLSIICHTLCHFCQMAKMGKK